MSADHSHLWPGVPLALLSAILFGASTPVSKLLLGFVDPQLLAGLLYLGAGLGLAVLHIGRVILGRAAAEAPLRRSDLPWLAAVIFVGGVVGPLLLMLGLARTEAASAALLLNLEGLATMGVAWVVFRENVDRRLLLGALAILAGAVAISWQGRGVVFDRGALLVAGACFAWGVDNNLTRKLSSADPVAIATAKGLAAGAFNIAVAFWLGAAAPSPAAVAGSAVVGFLGVGVSLVLFVVALRHLGTARTGAYFSLAPFIGAIVSILLLHDAVTPQLLVAAALMGFGLWTHLTEDHAHEHAHDALEHEHAHSHDAHHQHVHDMPVTEPHSHWHRHEPLIHAHPHYPDLHHRHGHEGAGPIPSDLLSGGKGVAAAAALAAAIGVIGFFLAPPAAVPPQQAARMEDGAQAPGFEGGPGELPTPAPEVAPAPPLAPSDADRLRAFLQSAAPAQPGDGFAVGLAFGKGARLAPEARERLDEIAQILVAFPKARVTIAAGPGGKRLRRTRVETVRRALIAAGVGASRIATPRSSAPMRIEPDAAIRLTVKRD